MALAIFWISYAIGCFLCAFHALHTLFLKFVDTFFEKVLPALGGEHDFENWSNVKSWQKDLLRPSNPTDYTHFGAGHCIWNLQNCYEKCVFPPYGPSLAALFAIMCSTACISDGIFLFLLCFRCYFVEKRTPVSEFTSHKCVRLTVLARYAVYMSPLRRIYLEEVADSRPLVAR